jgi:hypothetical protein
VKSRRPVREAASPRGELDSHAADESPTSSGFIMARDKGFETESLELIDGHAKVALGARVPELRVVACVEFVPAFYKPSRCRTAQWFASTITVAWNKALAVALLASTHPNGTMISAMSVTFRKTIPILRIFDIEKAREFYVDYLGFGIDWEHRFSDDAPLYMQVSRGDLVLHLSEHYGDGTPGSVVYVETAGVPAFHAELQAKRYRYLKPGIEVDEIGTCVTLIDPFGNTLRVNEPHRTDTGRSRIR